MPPYPKGLKSALTSLWEHQTAHISP